MCYLLLCAVLLCSCSSSTPTTKSTIQPTASQKESGMIPMKTSYIISPVSDYSEYRPNKVLTSNMKDGKAKIELYLCVYEDSNIKYFTFEYTPRYECCDPKSELILSKTTDKIEISSEDYTDEGVTKKIVSFYLELPKKSDNIEYFDGDIDIEIKAYSEDGELLRRYSEYEELLNIYPEDKKFMSEYSEYIEHITIHYIYEDKQFRYIM